MKGNIQSIRRALSLAAVVLLCAVASMSAYAANTARQIPNTDPTYIALRDITLGSEAVSLRNVVLKREFATFTFKSGVAFFLAPVDGKVTGAVFIGDGQVELKPRMAAEQHSLWFLSKSPDFVERFEVLVLRFTDDTYRELKNAGAPTHDTAQLGRAGRSFADDMSALHAHNRVRYNLNTRILQDLLATSPGGLFVAFVHGKNFSDKGLFFIDPQGAVIAGVEPEEVVYMTYDPSKYGIWAVNHLDSEYASGAALSTQVNAAGDVQTYKGDVELKTNANLQATVNVTFVALRDGMRVAPFRIFDKATFQSVTDEAGQPLPFIFESKGYWAEYSGPENLGVILPKPLAAGERCTIRFNYRGPAFSNKHDDYYYFGVRSWIPYTRGVDYAEYDMTFETPKDMAVDATYMSFSEKGKGRRTATYFKTQGPASAVRFNYGTSGRQEFGEIVAGGYHDDDWGEIKLLTDYFGPIPYRGITLPDRFSYHPIQSWDDWVREGVAHLWWGYTVAPASYRDMWLRDGFTGTSASLFAEFVDKKRYLFGRIWQRAQDGLKGKNAFGYRVNDVGPITMGFRTDSSSSCCNWVYTWDSYGDSSNSEYIEAGKGAFVLHMLRRMMWSKTDGDARFKEMMHDFVKTFSMKPASTENFKAIVEEHITPEMDLDHNGKMDWFFDQWVYGTELPKYTFSYKVYFDGTSDVLDFKINQSGVSENFRMPVPVYAELKNGDMVRLTTVVLTGNGAVEQKLSLGAQKINPNKVMINYNYDVLSDN